MRDSRTINVEMSTYHEFNSALRKMISGMSKELNELEQKQSQIVNDMNAQFGAIEVLKRVISDNEAKMSVLSTLATRESSLESTTEKLAQQVAKICKHSDKKG